MRPTPTRHPWWVPLVRGLATSLIPAILGGLVLMLAMTLLSRTALVFEALLLTLSP